MFVEGQGSIQYTYIQYMHIFYYPLCYGDFALLLIISLIFIGIIDQTGALHAEVCKAWYVYSSLLVSSGSATHHQLMMVVLSNNQ